MEPPHPAPITFRSLAKQEGARWDEPLPQNSPLEQWFASVCDLPLDALSVGDLSRSCRQQLFLEAVVPFCLQALTREPLAGELYDGELLTAMMRLPSDYWSTHPGEEPLALSAAEAAFDMSEDENLRQDIAGFLSVRRRAEGDAG